MRKGDGEKEKDFVSAHCEIWSSVYEADVSENEHMNRRRRRHRCRCLTNSHMRKSSRTHTSNAPPAEKDFFEIVYMKFIGCDWRSYCCCSTAMLLCCVAAITYCMSEKLYAILVLTYGYE